MLLTSPTPKRGSSWQLGYAANAAEVRLPLIGDFNVSNAVAAAAAALALGRPLQGVAAGLAGRPTGSWAAGAYSRISYRYKRLCSYTGRAATGVWPRYAHSRVDGIIVVFGAGGDRDAGKRPIMGSIAERGADVVIVTSDNPRTESPAAIVDDIERGMTTGMHERILDRRCAIMRAISLAHQDDVVLLAGKGHETYQVVGTEKHHFDERDIVHELLASR